MNRIKNIVSILATFALLISASLVTSCNDHGDLTTDDSLRDPFVFSLTPSTDQYSGLDVGTEMTLTGHSLDKIGWVSICTNNDAATSIVDVTIEEFTSVDYQISTFILPYGDFETTNAANADYVGDCYHQKLRIYDRDGVAIWGKDDLYVNVPYDRPTISSVDVTEATIGDQVVISGYLFDQVEYIMLRGEGVEVDIYASDFYTAGTSAYKITFTIPDNEQFKSKSVNDLTITFVYNESDTIAVTDDFAVLIPDATSQTPLADTYYEDLTVTGVNLDLISSITFAGVECEIISVSESGETLVYQIPYDTSFTTQTVTDVVYGYYGTAADPVTLCASFELDVPDPTPKGTTSISEGTYGDIVVINGYFLDEVTSIEFGSYISFNRSEFTYTSEFEISVVIPALTSGSYDAAFDITLVYSGGTAIVAEDFEVFEPVVTNYPSEGSYNTELTITGTNLDLVNGITFCGVSATIVEYINNGLVFTLPLSSAYDAFIDPGADSVTGELLGTFGSGYYPLTIASSFTLDISESSATVTDIIFTKGADTTEDYYGVYLNTTFELVGENLDLVESIIIGDYEATITSKGANSLMASVSSDYEFKTATLVSDVMIVDTEGKARLLRDFKVYPFFYYTDIFMSGRENRGGTFESFFNADLGIVYDTCGVSGYEDDVTFLVYDQVGYVAFYSPANAGSIIGNYTCDDVKINESGAWTTALTKATTFRSLNPGIHPSSNDNDEHVAVIEAYKAKSIPDFSALADLSTPSSSSPKAYLTELTAYSASSMSVNEYPWAFIWRADSDKFGMIKITYVGEPNNYHTDLRTTDVMLDFLWPKYTTTEEAAALED